MTSEWKQSQVPPHYESQLVEETNANPMNHIFTDQVKDKAWAIPTRRYLKKSSTEFRRDLNFEGLRPRTYGRMYSSLGRNGLLNPRSSNHRHWPL